MKDKDYDFAGWVTKNDLLCSDGVVIKHDAFKDNDGVKVPLVWDHDHNSPNNVLGHVILHNMDKGVYGYGYFNGTEEAKGAKASIEHGDISAMSIAANQIKREGQNVVHGRIFEVSLVLAGANPGALITDVISHSDDSTESAIIYTGNLIHASDDVVQQADNGGSPQMNDEENKQSTDPKQSDESEKTIGEIINEMTPEQQDAVNALIGSIVEEYGLDKDKPADDSQDQPSDAEDDKKKQVVQQNDEGGKVMKHNVFEGKENNDTLIASQNLEKFNEGLKHAIEDKGTLKAMIKDEGLEHSITNIETLFPEAKTASATPFIYDNQNTAAADILAGIRKLPFSRIKTMYADLTPAEARAKGYIKGKEKLEEKFSVLHRETTPQTVYKKQKLDRDDIIDITDFNVVQWLQSEMRAKLNEEIARAILVGDGREANAEDKINVEHIRPIVSDDDLYAIKVEVPSVEELMESIIINRANYYGSGRPSIYINPTTLAQFKLLKGTDGRFLFGDIPSNEAMAARLDVAKIVPSSFLPVGQLVLVNLADYAVGATKGGEVTTFDDFDIDFNQYKYLIETRLSGALTTPKSAIVFTIKAAGAPTEP